MGAGRGRFVAARTLRVSDIARCRAAGGIGQHVVSGSADTGSTAVSDPACSIRSQRETERASPAPGRNWQGHESFTGSSRITRSYVRGRSHFKRHVSCPIEDWVYSFMSAVGSVQSDEGGRFRVEPAAE